MKKFLKRKSKIWRRMWAIYTNCVQFFSVAKIWVQKFQEFAVTCNFQLQSLFATSAWTGIFKNNVLYVILKGLSHENESGYFCTSLKSSVYNFLILLEGCSKLLSTCKAERWYMVWMIQDAGCFVLVLHIL